MKIGLQIPRFDWPDSPHNIGSKLIEIAKAADEAGFSSLWVMDHFYQVGQGYGPPESHMLEGYSTMSYLAAITKKIKLGLMVTSSFYRHPGVLVKTVTTLDVLSSGRAYLGIGAGWYEQEAKGMGIPYPKTAGERLGRLRETLQIAKHMWNGDTSSFAGKYYHLEHPVNSPQPLSKPHPPILIGGGGEKVTLRLVAKYGDASNLHLGAHPKLEGYTPRHCEYYRERIPRITRKLSILKKHCQEVGRSFNEIECTTLAPIKIAPDAMTHDDVLDMCKELSALGIHHAIFNMSNSHEIEPIEIIGEEIIPQVSDLESFKR